MNYYVILFGKDGNRTIRTAIDSLLSQTIPPARIMIIDDGSKDGMYETVLEYERKHPQLIKVHQTGSTTRDFSRLPLLWNMGLLKGYDCHVILPSDDSLSPDYAERMLAEFERNPELVIASGGYGDYTFNAPIGGGRFVRSSFFEKHYPNGYPRILGYESEILERATLEGYQVKVLNDVKLVHHDRLGHSHDFKEFGYGMKCLGYHPVYVLARVVWDFFNNKAIGRTGALKMFRYYLTFRPEKTGYYSPFPADIRAAVRERQKRMLVRIPRSLAGRALRSLNLR